MHTISLVLLAVATLAPAAGGNSQGRGPNPQDLLGKPAPAIKVDNWLNTNGKPLTMASLRGKVIVLDYWAHW